jgi:hypothetical protein
LGKQTGAAAQQHIAGSIAEHSARQCVFDFGLQVLKSIRMLINEPHVTAAIKRFEKIVLPIRYNCGCYFHMSPPITDRSIKARLSSGEIPALRHQVFVHRGAKQALVTWREP